MLATGSIYLASPKAEFWGAINERRFNDARKQVVNMAREHGIIVIDSTPMFEELCVYRSPSHPRRIAWASNADYGPTNKWRQIVDTVQLTARYICMSDNLRLGLASVPHHAWVGRRDHHLPGG